MVCDPGANNINIPSPGPGPSLPGLGFPFAVPKIPFPDVALPAGIPEDIIALIEKIFALFPQGIRFIPNTDSFTKGIWDALASLFNQMAPFLGFYKFIQALLNIILCIIDVLCALFSPWATARAVRRLFRRCLPDFLALFPWVALIVMILALILLLIALIEYLLALILSYINQILKNIEILTRAITVGDEEAIVAAVNKFAYVICLIEQLFSILLAFAALFAVIKALMDIGGRGVCQKGDVCCTEDFCPDFIANGDPNGQRSDTGRLIYFRPIEPIIPSDPLFTFLGNVSLPNVRNELWQFVDDDPINFRFVDIITPSPEFGFIYWPEGETYDSDSNIVRVPYLLDMNLSLDPAEFGNPSDEDGFRKFSVQDIIVSRKPTPNPVSFDNGFDVINPITGALALVGGSVYEYSDDGYSPYLINGEQATLQTLIALDPLSSNTLPASDDGYSFLDVQYNFRYNYEVLIDKKLITMMCEPGLSVESEITNSEFSEIRSPSERLGDLPDIGTLDTSRKDGTGALGCLARALTKFRQNINAESAAVFQSEVTQCLNDLKTDAEDFYCRGALDTADRFTSDFEIDPDLQFIDDDIKVTVRLRDRTGTQIGLNLSDALGSCVADAITAQATFGTVSSFIYDGYGDFIATLTSDIAGTGELTALINGETISDVVNRDSDDDTVTSEIITRVLPYEFVDGRFGNEKTRFGPPDVAEDGA